MLQLCEGRTTVQAFLVRRTNAQEYIDTGVLSWVNTNTYNIVYPAAKDAPHLRVGAGCIFNQYLATNGLTPAK